MRRESINDNGGNILIHFPFNDDITFAFESISQQSLTMNSNYFYWSYDDYMAELIGYAKSRGNRNNARLSGINLPFTPGGAIPNLHLHVTMILLYQGYGFFDLLNFCLSTGTFGIYNLFTFSTDSSYQYDFPLLYDDMIAHDYDYYYNTTDSTTYCLCDGIEIWNAPILDFYWPSDLNPNEITLGAASSNDGAWVTMTNLYLEQY